MKARLSAWLDSFFPPDGATDAEAIRKYRLFINSSFIISIFAACYGIMSYFIGFSMGQYSMAVSVLFFGTLPFLLKKGINFWLLGATFSAYTILLNAVLVAYSGGLFVSPVTPFIILTPVFSLLFCNYRTALIFVAICVIYVIAFSTTRQTMKAIPITYGRQYHEAFLMLALGGLVVIMFLIANSFETTKNNALKMLVDKQADLEKEEARSTMLLLNILPAATVKELKEQGTAKPQRYEMVSVMFADFVSFTKVSERLSAVDLVKEIDFYFTAFDEIISRYKVEKIKTIGDSYMCVCGMPLVLEDHAQQMISAAFDILSFIEKTKQQHIALNKSYFDIRIGINSGPVVAGVVGKSKFAYDIWGDTVNTAARMQQQSEPARVNISGSTYDLIKHCYDCNFRGKVAAKNKGLIDMYYVQQTPGPPNPPKGRA
jgi:class 3 adenylate cyclase